MPGSPAFRPPKQRRDRRRTSAAASPGSLRCRDARARTRICDALGLVRLRRVGDAGTARRPSAEAAGHGGASGGAAPGPATGRAGPSASDQGRTGRARAGPREGPAAQQRARRRRRRARGSRVGTSLSTGTAARGTSAAARGRRRRPSRARRPRHATRACAGITVLHEGARLVVDGARLVRLVLRVLERVDRVDQLVGQPGDPLAHVPRRRATTARGRQLAEVRAPRPARIMVRAMSIAHDASMFETLT